MANSVNKSKDKIESMFDEIAPTYDKLNHLFTLNTDRRWRRDIIKYLSKNCFKFETILDLASGTGDLTRVLFELNPLKVYSADISKKMLEIQKRKITDSRLELVHADALNLSFPDNTFDLITIGFGIRNFEDLEGSLKEICRVLKKGGMLVILEMFKSNGLKTKLFNLYFGKVMPFVGNKISGSSYAYNYLFKSVSNFYEVNEFTSICSRLGFKVHKVQNNFLGVVNTVYLSKE